MKFLADENLDGRLWRALRSKVTLASIERAQDVGLLGGSDLHLLQWAYDRRSIILTQDKRTFAYFIRERIESGQHSAGVLIIRPLFTIPLIVREVELICVCSTEEEWVDRLEYLPL